MASRKSYTLLFKKEVLTTLENLNGNVSATARKYPQITRQHIIRWREQKDDILQLTRTCSSSSFTPSKRKSQSDGSDDEGPLIISPCPARKRRRIRSRQAQFPLLEEALVEYTKEMREKGLAVHRNMIMHKALVLIKDLYPKEALTFKASDGWCYNFMRRNDIRDRRVTR